MSEKAALPRSARVAPLDANGRAVDDALLLLPRLDRHALNSPDIAKV
jgi:hypothetical protein